MISEKYISQNNMALQLAEERIETLKLACTKITYLAYEDGKDPVERIQEPSSIHMESLRVMLKNDLDDYENIEWPSKATFLTALNVDINQIVSEWKKEVSSYMSEHSYEEYMEEWIEK